jgi:GGDEF domain-containing protein
MQPVPEQPGKHTEQVSLEDCLLLLLRGIQDHPVVAEEAEGKAFQSEIAALEQAFKGRENAHHLVESAIGILDRYSTQANEIVSRQRTGLAKASSDLAAAKDLAFGQGPSDRLASLEQQINALSSGDDLAKIKSRMISEVAMARAEALQERQKVSDLISGTITQLAPPEPSRCHVSHVVGSDYAVDALTGLPRAYAENELRRSHDLPIDTYLAIFVVKRLALINSKFGFARGDQLLIKVAGALAQSMPEFGSLFRWAPCAFLTLPPPGTAYRELRSKVQVIEVTRMTPTLEWQGRSAMVPVALDCRVVSVKDFSTASELFLRLDSFASSE